MTPRRPIWLHQLHRGGVPSEGLLTLLAENVRKHEQVLGDIFSSSRRTDSAPNRPLRFMDDYGMHGLRALAAVVQDRSEAAVRDAIRALPDGIYLASEPQSN